MYKLEDKTQKCFLNELISDGEPDYSGDKSSKTHKSGWTIEGLPLYGGYLTSFEAHHEDFGRVAGNFGDCFIAETKEALDNFFVSHKPSDFPKSEEFDKEIKPSETLEQMIERIVEKIVDKKLSGK